LYGCSTCTSSFAAKSALMLRIWPPTVSPSDAITGIEPAAGWPRSEQGARASPRHQAVALAVEVVGIEHPGDDAVARASDLPASASTSFRFCAWNTRRTIASASGVVTRSPLTVCLTMPAADIPLVELRARRRG
jgi:hypothetical protein